LIDRYWTHYGSKKRSADREKSIVEGIRSELGRMFVREVDGIAVQRWYENLTGVAGSFRQHGVRHFNVMHHMMEKASTIWSKETGIDRNPADPGRGVGGRRFKGPLSFGRGARRLKQALTRRCTARVRRTSTRRSTDEADRADRRHNRDALRRFTGFCGRT
jgi:hypothetical protein